VLDRPGQVPIQERRTRVYPPLPPADAGTQAVSVLAALNRHRVALAVSILAAPILAGVAVSRLPPRYTATGTLIYEPADYAPRELQSILRVDTASDAVMASQAEVIRSLPAAEALERRYTLTRNAAFNPALKPPGLLGRTLAAVFGKPSAPPADAIRQAVLARIEASIGAEALRGSRVVAVSFTADEPALAAGAANFLMQRYIDEQLEAKFEAVRRASQWLETRVAELRQEVQNAEDRIAAYRAQQGLVQGVQAGLDTEQVSRLNNELVQARADLAQAEGRLEAARGRAGAAALAAVAPSVTALRNQLDQMNAQLQAQLTRVGPNHPDAIGLRNQLADLQHAVASEAGRVIAATEADVRASRAKVAALESALKGAQVQEDTTAQAQVPLNAMQREADAARTMLNAVLEREQQTVQQTAIEKPDARIISPALPPLSPSAPKSMLIIGLASVAGVLLGGTFVYLLEATNRTLRSGEDVRSKLGVPCFALIPALSRRTLGRHRFEDYVAQKPMSPLAEQLRALRAGLWLGSLTPRVVAVTAARPAEGKTALSVALGRSMAMAGQRICIVDCDIRERAIARLMRAEGEAGLTDVLLGFTPIERAIRTDRLTSMCYLPAGSRQANSFGLFMTEGMSALVRHLREQFDAVLLDVPPVLAMADARVAARLADATLLCARWNHTPVHVVAHSLELLEEAQAHVCGMTLTRVDARLHQHSGYADADIYHARYAGYYRD